jgi:hypothetical protein
MLLASCDTKLNAELTHINGTNIKPKRGARKVRNIPHIIAPIENRSHPMGNRSPDRNPRNKLRVNIRNALCDRNIIHRVVEQRDESSNANNSQRLCRQQAEDNSGQCGRKESLIDAKVAVRVPLHVKLERQRRQEVDKEDPDCAGERAVVEAVCDVAPVVWQSSADVPVHAPEGTRHAVGFPSCESFPGVGVVPEVGRHDCATNAVFLV